MYLYKLILCFIVCATVVRAERDTKLCDEDKHSTKKKHNLRNQHKRECKVDEDCPQIQCVRAPCPQLTCHESVCIADRMNTDNKNHAEDGKQALPEKEDDFITAECTSALQCPQVRCAIGYPCPSFECQNTKCVDVSNGEPAAPCTSDSQCFGTGHVCVRGLCLQENPDPLICQTDVKICPDGTTLNRGAPDCSFPPCPEAEKCGTTICKPGTTCCNSSCGVCVPPGGVCTQQICDPPLYIKCNEDRDCPNDSDSCIEGKCAFIEQLPPTYIKCNQVEDCPNEFDSCIEGKCVLVEKPVDPVVECYKETDCPVFACLAEPCPFFKCTAENKCVVEYP